MAHIPGKDGKERRRFIAHYLEMIVAMIVGMVIGGGLVSLFCSLTGHEDLLEHAGVSAPIMATNMVVGMTAWMRLRGHDWQAIGEMAAAMYVPLAIFIVPFWVGLVSGGTLLSGMHPLMLPAMWLVMARRPAAYVHVHRLPEGDRIAHAR